MKGSKINKFDVFEKLEALLRFSALSAFSGLEFCAFKADVNVELSNVAANCHNSGKLYKNYKIFRKCQTSGYLHSNALLLITDKFSVFDGSKLSEISKRMKINFHFKDFLFHFLTAMSKIIKHLV